MTTFETETRHYWRNSRCRSKLPTPERPIDWSQTRPIDWSQTWKKLRLIRGADRCASPSRGPLRCLILRGFAAGVTDDTSATRVGKHTVICHLIYTAHFHTHRQGCETGLISAHGSHRNKHAYE
jgi:hypothetical protein